MTDGPRPARDAGVASGACVTMHVGQLKTATTSLQAGLFASRGALDRAGVQYHPGAGRHHNREAYDLFRRDDESFDFKSTAFQHTVKVALADGRPYWPDFVGSVHRHPGRTILSAEVLAFAGAGTTELVAQAFPDVPVRIVVTTRPLSQLVISIYGEWAKKYPLPDPDAVARTILTGLIERGPASRHSWMTVDRLRSVWGPVATGGWHEVPLGGRPIEAYQLAFWRAVGIESLVPPPLATENRTLPTGALLAWQEHLHEQGSYDHRVDGGTIARVLRGLSEKSSAPRSRLQLRGDVAQLADACFPSLADVAAAPRATFDELRDRLAGSEPVTESVPVGAPQSLDDEVEYWGRTLERSRRLVRARIGVARRLGLRHSQQPAWDRYRDESPARLGGSPLDEPR